MIHRVPMSHTPDGRHVGYCVRRVLSVLWSNLQNHSKIITFYHLYLTLSLLYGAISRLHANRIYGAQILNVWLNIYKQKHFLGETVNYPTLSRHFMVVSSPNWQ